MEKVSENIVEDPAGLREQEIQFIRDTCNGFSHSEIGIKNGLSERRVHNVFHSIHNKTGCKTPMDILKFAFLHRIITWPERFSKKLDENASLLLQLISGLSIAC